MKRTPIYYSQEEKYTCSLAVLRMVLASFGKRVSEESLKKRVIRDYGRNFTDIWNPTIAKLACDFGLKVKLFALWPVLKKENFPKAFLKFEKEGRIKKFEKSSSSQKKKITASLSLAYQDLFLAVQKGCEIFYGGITENRIKKFLNDDCLILTSVKLEKLYSKKEDRKGFHSVLLYKIKDGRIFFHGPAFGKGQSCGVDEFLRSVVRSKPMLIFSADNTLTSGAN